MTSRSPSHLFRTGLNSKLVRSGPCPMEFQVPPSTKGPTTSQGSLFHCLTTLTAKNIFPCYEERISLAASCDCYLSSSHCTAPRRVCLCHLCNSPLPNTRRQLNLYSSPNKPSSLCLSSSVTWASPLTLSGLSPVYWLFL